MIIPPSLPLVLIPFFFHTSLLPTCMTFALETH